MSNRTFLEEMKEILDPHIGLEIGNDDIIYGSYIEWPSLEELDDETIRDLLSYLNIDIPLLETEGVFTDDDKEKIFELLREYGIPEGTEYENGGMDDYPESFKYYDSFEDEEYLFYKNFRIPHEKYREEILEIKTMIKSQQLPLVQKSLLLAAFVYTESYVKSIIGKRIPDKNSNIRNENFINMIHKYIKNKLTTTQGRKELFKELYNQKLPNIPNTAIRNVLAHDIPDVELKDEIIKYLDKEGNFQKISIDRIFDELQNYSNKLEKICTNSIN